MTQVSTDASAMTGLTLDESNAFTYIQVPVSWHKYQQGPKVRACELPPDWVGERWPPQTILRPRYTRLGMGHTHAAYILLAINMAAILRAFQASSRSVRRSVPWPTPSAKALLAQCPLERQAQTESALNLEPLHPDEDVGD